MYLPGLLQLPKTLISRAVVEFISITWRFENKFLGIAGRSQPGTNQCGETRATWCNGVSQPSVSLSPSNCKRQEGQIAIDQRLTKVLAATGYPCRRNNRRCYRQFTSSKWLRSLPLAAKPLGSSARGSLRPQEMPTPRERPDKCND